MREKGRKSRGLVTVDFGEDVAEIDGVADKLRAALKDTAGFRFRRITRSFILRLALRLLSLSLKRNELLKLMRLLTEDRAGELRPLGEGE